MCLAPIAIRIKLLFITELQIANVTLSQPLRELVRRRLCPRLRAWISCMGGQGRVNIYQSTSTPRLWRGLSLTDRFIYNFCYC